MNKNQRKLNVVHLLPSLGIGGVEVGIVKSYASLQKQIDYQIVYARSAGSYDLGQRSVWNQLFRIAFYRESIDVIVTSLWSAHLFGLIAWCIGVKWIAFYHSSGVSHSLESLVLSLAWRFADMRLVDSNTCGTAMASKFGRGSWRVINYHFPAYKPTKPWPERKIDIVFVGRAAHVKRLDLVVRLIDHYAQRRTNFRVVFAISGKPPDCVKKLANRQSTMVEIRIDVSYLEVENLLANSQYFISLSDFEGFSMATAEAVMAGTIPVVRPVGEIKHYVSQESGVIVNDITDVGLSEISEQMVRLRASPSKATAMASLGWYQLMHSYRPYCESFVAALKEVNAH